MAMWDRCAICGKSIPVGELCYGVKNWRGDPIGGDTICRDCLVPENAPTLTPPNEWVSVEERLPEHLKDVIALYGNGRIDIDWVDSSGDFKFGSLFDGVTHWMPLPTPPDRRPPEGEENV